MPKQASHIKLIGSIDNLNYYQTKDGFIVRKKSSLSGSRIFKDACFKRSRENLKEFAVTAKANKLIRNSIATLSKNIADRRLMNRLTSILFQIIRTDGQHTSGNRRPESGDLNLLNGFEFNINNPFAQAFSGTVKTEINRASGEVTIIQDAYDPREAFKHPIEASHYRFVYGAVAQNFAEALFERSLKLGEILSFNELFVPTIRTILPLPADSNLPIFTFIGMEFFQLSADGNFSLLQNGAYSSLQIAGVDQVMSSIRP